MLGLDLAILDIDLVANKNNWDGLANSCKILVPLWNVRVGNARAYIKHDDAALTANVITITQSSKLLLTCGIPNVENDLTVVSEKGHRVDFNTECSDVLLFELSGQVAFDEGCFANTTVTDEDKLEFWNLLLNHLKAQS